MSTDGPRRVSDLLLSGDIGRLKSEALARRELAAEVRASLPDAEAAHVVSAHVDAEGRLIIGVDSAAWAARLRFLAPELLGRTLRVRVISPGASGS